jgi:hypothetical protein
MVPDGLVIPKGPGLVATLFRYQTSWMDFRHAASGLITAAAERWEAEEVEWRG